jgi:hypothetical protein
VRRAAAAIGGIFALTFLFAIPALAQTYPPQTPTVGVGAGTVTVGGQLLVTGDNWLGGSTVNLELHSQVFSLGTAQVGANGSFSKLVTIPSSVSPGAHTIEVHGTAANGKPAVSRTSITIVSAGGGGGTALTGANISRALLLLVGLVLVGFVTLFVTRRRTSTSRRVQTG